MSAKEEEITKEDLQAMKDMIKAIKMDPSLLYRLSSLPNDAVIAEAGEGKVFVDDDATDVSSLSLSNDWVSGGHSQYHPPMPKGASGGGGIGSIPCNLLSSNDGQTSFAFRKTNHDADIALRMQSLQAKRIITNSNHSLQGGSGSPQVSMRSLKGKNMSQVKSLLSVSEMGNRLLNANHGVTLTASLARHKILSEKNDTTGGNNFNGKPVSLSSLAPSSKNTPSRSSSEGKARERLDAERHTRTHDATHDDNYLGKGVLSAKRERESSEHNPEKAHVESLRKMQRDDEEASSVWPSQVVASRDTHERGDFVEGVEFSNRHGSPASSALARVSPPPVAQLNNIAVYDPPQNPRKTVSGHRQLRVEASCTKILSSSSRSPGRGSNGQRQQRVENSLERTPSSSSPSPGRESSYGPTHRQRRNSDSLKAPPLTELLKEKPRSRSTISDAKRRDWMKPIPYRPSHHHLSGDPDSGICRVGNNSGGLPTHSHKAQQVRQHQQQRSSSSNRRSPKSRDDPPSHSSNQHALPAGARPANTPLDPESLIGRVRATQQQQPANMRDEVATAIDNSIHRFGNRTGGLPTYSYKPQQVQQHQQQRSSSSNRRSPKSRDDPPSHSSNQHALPAGARPANTPLDPESLIGRVRATQQQQPANMRDEVATAIDNSIHRFGNRTGGLPTYSYKPQQVQQHQQQRSSSSNRRSPKSRDDPPSHSSNQHALPAGARPANTPLDPESLIERVRAKQQQQPAKMRDEVALASDNALRRDFNNSGGLPSHSLTPQQAHQQQQRSSSSNRRSTKNPDDFQLQLKNLSAGARPISAPLDPESSNERVRTKEQQQKANYFRGQSSEDSYSSVITRLSTFQRKVSGGMNGAELHPALRTSGVSPFELGSTISLTNVSDGGRGPDHLKANPHRARGAMTQSVVTTPGTLKRNPTCNITHGIELAIRSGEVPRICDQRGRCLFHPHIRLQKPKLFGGWKVLFQHCPDCAVEHMKKTYEKLITTEQDTRKKDESEERHHEKEKKKRSIERLKEKHLDSKRRTDPILGKSVGDEGFTVDRVEVRGKNDGHHTPRKKEKEKPKEDIVGAHLMPKEIQDKSEPIHDEGYFYGVQEKLEAGSSREFNRRTQEQSPEQTTEQKNEQKTEESLPQLESQAIVLHIESQNIKSPPPENQTNDIKRKPKTVNGLPWSDYNGHSGRYTGEINEKYLPHGGGEMIYDRGVISSGIWFNGVLDTEDTSSSLVISMSVSKNEYSSCVLSGYSIGDKGSDGDMMIDSKKATAAAVGEIRANDAAFVRRSDGTWTYAIVKDRSHGASPSIRFKVNARGSTKEFPMSQWGTYVRPIGKRCYSPPANATSSSDSGLSPHLDSRKLNLSSGTISEGSIRSKHMTLSELIGDSKRNLSSGANSVGGDLMRSHSGDLSVVSAHSAPLVTGDSSSSKYRSFDNLNRSFENLTTAKMKITTRSRSKSRNRKKVTTLPLLFSSAMSVSEENDEGHDTDNWETASGSGYRLRGLDP